MEKIKIKDSKVKDSEQSDIIREIKSKYPEIKVDGLYVKKYTNEQNFMFYLRNIDNYDKKNVEKFVEYLMKQKGYKNLDISHNLDKTTKYLDKDKFHYQIFVYGNKPINDSLSDSIKYSLKTYSVNGKIIKAKDEFDAIKKVRDDMSDFTIIAQNDGFYIKHKNGKVYDMYFSSELDAKDYLKTHLGLVTSKIADSKTRVKDFRDWMVGKAIELFNSGVNGKELLDAIRQIDSSITEKEAKEIYINVTTGKWK